MGICAHCGQNSTAWSCTCAKVWRKACANGQPKNRAAVQEAFEGYTTAGLCSQCQAVLAARTARARAPFSLAAAVIMAVPAFWLFLSGHNAVALVFLAMAATACVLLRILERYPAVLLKRRLLTGGKALLLARLVPYRNYVLVPLENGLYRDLKDFQKNNPLLLPGFAEKFYRGAVENDAWESGRMTDVEIDPEEGIQKAAGDLRQHAGSESGSLINHAVRDILRLFRENPDGICSGSEAAEELRRTGLELQAAGGYELMKIVHQLISRSCDNSGDSLRLLTDLESRWDGIGYWGRG